LWKTLVDKVKGHSCTPNNFIVPKDDKNIAVLKDFCQQSDDTQPYIYDKQSYIYDTQLYIYDTQPYNYEQTLRQLIAQTVVVKSCEVTIKSTNIYIYISHVRKYD